MYYRPVDHYYAYERFGTLRQDTMSKLSRLAAQLRTAADAGLISDPQIAVDLHAASHATWTSAAAMRDSLLAVQISSSWANNVHDQIWRTHQLIDRIVRDAQKDRESNSLADPPNYAGVLLRLAAEMEKLVENLRAETLRDKDEDNLLAFTMFVAVFVSMICAVVIITLGLVAR